MLSKNLNILLVNTLKKQRYPYMWELALFSMKAEDQRHDFHHLTWNRLELKSKKAAIAFPQYSEHLKTKEDIVAFLKEVSLDENRVCVLIVHADYNPADLMAIYLLEYPLHGEETCYEEVLSRWSACSEVYFCSALNSEIEKYISLNTSKEGTKPVKKQFFKRVLKLFA